MNSRRARLSRVAVGLLLAGLVGRAQQAEPPAEQDGLGLRFTPDGRVQVWAGAEQLMTLELNAHGPKWSHAGQEKATATRADADTERDAGVVFSGSLPVPNTEGGAIEFVETLEPIESGFSAVYKLRPNREVLLNGLQLSLLLPTARFTGKEIALRAAEGEPTRLTLPRELNGEKWVLGAAECNGVEVAPGAPDAIALTTEKAARLVVQDLRQWQKEVFEVRLALITADEGELVSADRRYSVKIDVTFARPLFLEEAAEAEGEQ